MRGPCLTNNTDRVSSAVLCVGDLSVKYNNHLILSDINLEITKGQLVAIVGPNGAGKSTLLKACLGLIPTFKGDVKILGSTLNQVSRQVSYLPQREVIDWTFPIDVEGLVMMGRYVHRGLFQRMTEADHRLVSQALDQVGMSAYRHRQIGELSGGQQQRVFLARALAQEPRLYFMDEPFAAVDQKTEQRLVEVMRKKAEEGGTCFVVHHNLHTLHEYFDWVILLNRHLIASLPTSAITLPEILKQGYGWY